MAKLVIWAESNWAEGKNEDKSQHVKESGSQDSWSKGLEELRLGRNLASGVSMGFSIKAVNYRQPTIKKVSNL